MPGPDANEVYGAERFGHLRMTHPFTSQVVRSVAASPGRAALYYTRDFRRSQYPDVYRALEAGVRLGFLRHRFKHYYPIPLQRPPAAPQENSNEESSR